MKFPQVVIVAVLGISISAQADWSPSARNQFQKLNASLAKHPMNDELRAVRSSAEVTLGSVLRSLRFRKDEFTSKEFFDGTGKPAYYYYSRTGRKVSPLVVFFPGVFGDPESGGSLLVGRQTRRARNHTVILPNPWGEDYQNANPKNMPGDFEKEAAVMLEMVKRAVKKIGPERISKIEFLGESYGGFLATTTAVLAEQTASFHVDSVTSISVPYHIGNAIQVLDQMADANEAAYFDRGCQRRTQGIFRMVGLVYEILSTNDRDIFSDPSTPCGDAIFSFTGFQQSLYALGRRLDARKASIAWEAHPLDYWSRHLRFRDFGELFFGKDTIDIVNQKSADLGYWVRQLQASGTEARAMVAADDPLNPPPGVGVHQVAVAYGPNDILILGSGGHLGFRGDGNYKKFLREAFKASGTQTAGGFGGADQLTSDDEDSGDDEDLDNDASQAADHDVTVQGDAVELDE